MKKQIISQSLISLLGYALFLGLPGAVATENTAANETSSPKVEMNTSDTLSTNTQSASVPSFLITADQAQGANFQEMKISFKNDVLSIEATTNPTTGFDWYIVDFNDSTLKILDSDYEYLAEDPDIVGAPSLGFYGVKFMQEGTHTFSFTYMRSWEPEDYVRKYRFVVDVNADGKISQVQVEGPVKNPSI